MATDEEFLAEVREVVARWVEEDDSYSWNMIAVERLLQIVDKTVADQREIDAQIAEQNKIVTPYPPDYGRSGRIAEAIRAGGL